MSKEKWAVYRYEYSSDTYLSGSEFIYHKLDEVEYKNNLMPSGTVIKQWYSKTNYQKQRIEPTLPIIDGESRYQITVNIVCPEKERWLVRLVFYDKYDVEVGYVTVREKETEFVLVEQEKCIGCKKCEKVCPVGVIYFGKNGKMEKCDGCTARIREGRRPACEQVCCTGAIKLILSE